jgi:hypothetical protein
MCLAWSRTCASGRLLWSLQQREPPGRQPPSASTGCTSCVIPLLHVLRLPLIAWAASCRVLAAAPQRARSRPAAVAHLDRLHDSDCLKGKSVATCRGCSTSSPGLMGGPGTAAAPACGCGSGPRNASSCSCCRSGSPSAGPRKSHGAVRASSSASSPSSPMSCLHAAFPCHGPRRITERRPRRICAPWRHICGAPQGNRSGHRRGRARHGTAGACLFPHLVSSKGKSSVVSPSSFMCMAAASQRDRRQRPLQPEVPGRQWGPPLYRCTAFGGDTPAPTARGTAGGAAARACRARPPAPAGAAPPPLLAAAVISGCARSQIQLRPRRARPARSGYMRWLSGAVALGRRPGGVGLPWDRTECLPRPSVSMRGQGDAPAARAAHLATPGRSPSPATARRHPRTGQPSNMDP